MRVRAGEVRVVILDSQPIHQQRQEYRLVDAATGEFERGYVDVADMATLSPGPMTFRYTSRAAPAPTWPDRARRQARHRSASAIPDRCTTTTTARTPAPANDTVTRAYSRTRSPGP